MIHSLWSCVCGYDARDPLLVRTRAWLAAQQAASVDAPGGAT
ncbi:MAG TPA: hypothetical protein VFU46_12960 [Gemmatimonadales bacterium]|nr:hypothetical protein [Gemmatimonadales bacterium]